MPSPYPLEMGSLSGVELELGFDPRCGTDSTKGLATGERANLLRFRASKSESMAKLLDLRSVCTVIKARMAIDSPSDFALNGVNFTEHGWKLLETGVEWHPISENSFSGVGFKMSF